MKCARDGCKGEATHFPKICVPPKGHFADVPLEATITLGLCLDHCKGEDPQVFLANDGPTSIRQIFSLLTRGKCPPDFARAWIAPTPMEAPATVH